MSTQQERIGRAIESFRRTPTTELERLLKLMPSSDPDQATVDLQENMPAIYAVLAERFTPKQVQRRTYLIALTVETEEHLDLDREMVLDEVIENTVGFSSAREAIDESLGGATHPARLVGLMVVGRIPTYEEGN